MGGETTNLLWNILQRRVILITIEAIVGIVGCAIALADFTYNIISDRKK